MGDCGLKKNCWTKPTSCKDESDCLGIVTWVKDGDDIEFEVFGKKRWVAVGFSNDEKMADDSIHTCIQPESGSGEIITMKSTGKSLPPEVSPKFTINGTVEYDNSKLRCRFSRPIKSSNANVFSLTTQYILFWAQGNLNGKTLQPHVKAERGHSDGKVDFKKLPNAGMIDLKTCSTQKSCWKKPASCKVEKECEGIITWKKVGDSISFEMMGKKKYVALGFSSDSDMGDDSIHACLKPDTGSPVFKTYLSTGETSPPEKSYSKHSETKIETDGSVLRCRFTRPVTSGSSDVFNLDKDYYLLWAEGDLTGTALKKHSSTGHTDKKVKLASGPSSHAGNINANIALLTSVICLIVSIFMQ